MQDFKIKYKYVAFIIFLKVLYIVLNILLLPEEWVGFDFDRNIQIDNIFLEFVVLIVLLSVYLKYLKPGHPISFALTILFCMYVIPSNSCLVLSGYSITYFMLINLYNYLLLLFSGKTISRISTSEDIFDVKRFETNKKLQKALRLLTIFTCLGIIVYVYSLTGSISISGIFTDDLYDKRASLAEFYLENTDGIIAYIMLFWKSFYNSMLIIGFYLSLKNKRYFDIVLCIFTYLILFSFESQKSTLFRPIIAVFVYYLFSHKKLNKTELLFLYGYSLLCCIALVEYYFNKDSVIYTVVLRRMTYMPQYLSHAYFEFFNIHDKVWLTRDFFQLEKIVRLFIHTPYDHGPVWIISENCFPGIPSPNTGLFAEAFSQLGYIGIIVLPLILSYVIRIYYKYSLIFGSGAAAVLLSSFVLSLINIQILAPRGILVIIIFVMISIWIKSVSRNK